MNTDRTGRSYAGDIEETSGETSRVVPRLIYLFNIISLSRRREEEFIGCRERSELVLDVLDLGANVNEEFLVHSKNRFNVGQERT